MKIRVKWLGAALVSLLTVTAGCRLASTPETSTDGMSELQVEIRDMLQEGARAFNAVHLDAFMSDYYQSPNTTYIGGRGLVPGAHDHFEPSGATGASRQRLGLGHRDRDVRISMHDEVGTR